MIEYKTIEELLIQRAAIDRIIRMRAATILRYMGIETDDRSITVERHAPMGIEGIMIILSYQTSMGDTKSLVTMEYFDSFNTTVDMGRKLK